MKRALKKIGKNIIVGFVASVAWTAMWYLLWYTLGAALIGCAWAYVTHTVPCHGQFEETITILTGAVLLLTWLYALGEVLD